MYSLMIIDDEPIVREGIKHIIPWQEHGFELCSEGMNGEDGLEKIIKHQPDLVLVDIRMPGLDGLEVIKRTREMNINTKFIILSGYSDFEYAKSAILLEVVGYILKPIDEEELLSYILSVKVKLDQNKDLSKYHIQNEKKARQGVVYNMLFSRQNEEELMEYIELYQLDYSFDQYCVAILEQRGEEKQEWEQICKNMTKGIVEFDYLIIKNLLLLIIKDMPNADVVHQLTENNNKSRYLGKEGLQIAVGQNVRNFYDIQFSYEMARFLHDKQFLYEEEIIISLATMKKWKVKEEKNIVKRLCDYIEIGNVSATKQIIKEYGEYCKYQMYDETKVKISLIHHMILLNTTLEGRYKLSGKLDTQKVLEQLKNAESLKKVLEYIESYCESLYHVLETTGKDNVVKRMYAYMEKNYNQELKLEGMAKMLNYNNAYLGKLFKKEMGDSFNNMLDEIRIRNAKKLLLETDDKVYEISQQVGYSNIDYFYSKFKRLVGVSPKEYKNRGRSK